MATLTISLSDEEMRRLEVLSKRESLTIEQMVQLSACEFIGQPGDAFHATAKCVMEKNAELDGAIDLTHLHRASSPLSQASDIFPPKVRLRTLDMAARLLHQLRGYAAPGRHIDSA